MTAEQLIQQALLASGTSAQEFPDDQRRTMQRRIKNQRRELRRLNALLRGADLVNRTLNMEKSMERANGYRHAAQIAESIHYWPFGKRIGAYIRKWI